MQTPSQMPPARRGSPPARRMVPLRDGEVRQHFARAGWHMQAPAGSVPHAFVDEIVASSIVIRRIWHTPLVLVRDGPAMRSGFGALLQVEGDLSVMLSDGMSLGLDPHSALLHGATWPARMSTTAPTARIELEMAAPLVTAGERPWRLHRTAAPSPMWSILTSMVNAVLNSPLQPDNAAFPLLQASVESLAAGLWAESEPMARAGDGGQSGSAAVYRRAVQLIHDRAPDADFSVERLAEELGVSRRYLARLFRDRDASPSGALKAQRLAIARRLMAGGGSADLEEVARAAGFPSARTLRETLRRSDGRDVPVADAEPGAAPGSDDAHPVADPQPAPAT